MNDPNGLRYQAIPEIMKEENAGFPYMVYTFSDDTQIAREMGVAPFIVGKYAAQAKYFESAQIKEALRDFAETEEAVKTGKIEDKLGVELMIIKYSQK